MIEAFVQTVAVDRQPVEREQRWVQQIGAAHRERIKAKLARHAVKVILSFALMIQGRIALAELPRFLGTTSFFGEINRRFLHLSEAELCAYLVKDLQRAGALKIENGWLIAA